MPISALKVLELNEYLVNQGKLPLIENLCKRELMNPEGVGLDIRVGEVYQMKGEGFLGIENRRMPEIAGMESKDKRILMNPGDYFLVATMEKVNIPNEKISIRNGFECYLTPIVYPRSTLQRCGIQLLATKTDPGYSGELTFGLANIGGRRFEFEIGARMFNVVFYEVIGEIKRAYEGQHNMGRVSSDGAVEKQV